MDVMFSSDKNEWETPQTLFDSLDAHFHFTLDAASSSENAKCNRHFTKTIDGLKQSWKGETVFVNPPYGRNITGKWVEKAYMESQEHGITVVLLLPARTDTKWFHKYVINQATVKFLKGRLCFELGGDPILDKHGRPQSAPFPSMLVVFGGKHDVRLYK